MVGLIALNYFLIVAGGLSFIIKSVYGINDILVKELLYSEEASQQLESYIYFNQVGVFQSQVVEATKSLD